MTGALVGRGGPSRWLRLRTAVVDRVAALVLLPVLGPVVAYLAWRVRREDGPPSIIGLYERGPSHVPAMWDVD